MSAQSRQKIRHLTLALVATAALAACSSTSDDAQETPTDTPSASSIPSPDPAQADALVAALDAIAPGLAAEREDTIENARNTCSSILGGGNNLQSATVLRFSGDGVDSLTPTQADQIIAVIQAEPWCA